MSKICCVTDCVRYRCLTSHNLTLQIFYVTDFLRHRFVTLHIFYVADFVRHIFSRYRFSCYIFVTSQICYVTFFLHFTELLRYRCCTSHIFTLQIFTLHICTSPVLYVTDFVRYIFRTSLMFYVIDCLRYSLFTSQLFYVTDSYDTDRLRHRCLTLQILTLQILTSSFFRIPDLLLH